MSSETYVLQEVIRDATETKVVACGPMGYVLKSANALINSKKEKPTLILNKCVIDEEGGVLFTSVQMSIKTTTTVELAAQETVSARHAS